MGLSDGMTSGYFFHGLWKRESHRASKAQAGRERRTKKQCLGLRNMMALFKIQSVSCTMRPTTPCAQGDTETYERRRHTHTIILFLKRREQNNTPAIVHQQRETMLFPFVSSDPPRVEIAWLISQEIIVMQHTRQGRHHTGPPSPVGEFAAAEPGDDPAF